MANAAVQNASQANEAQLSVLVCGNGRMGALVAQLVADAPDLELAGQVGIEDVDVLDAATAPVADVVIDFTHPAMLPHLAAQLRAHPAALLSGTTGLGADEQALLDELAQDMPVCHAANYSLGVAALRAVVAQAARLLPGWDVEIVETHHNQKADAPSGTAKALVACVDPEAERPLVYGREGFVGARTQREIGVHAVRGGTVAGTHEVHFFGPDEELVLTHRATSRAIFANGAVTVARRLAACELGRHELDDLL